MSNQRYPLDWPAGYERYAYSRHYNRPKFKSISLTVAVAEVESQVRLLLDKKRLGDTDLVISSNIPLNKDNRPRADYSRSIITDPGVAVYFNYNREPVVLTCDKWPRIEDNLKAIATTIEDMRRIERNGVSDFIKRSFTGFKALPEYTIPHFWEVLGMPFMPTPTPANWSNIKDRYRDLVKVHHPDSGGDPEKFQKVTRAYNEAKNYFKNVIT